MDVVNGLDASCDVSMIGISEPDAAVGKWQQFQSPKAEASAATNAKKNILLKEF